MPCNNLYLWSFNVKWYCIIGYDIVSYNMISIYILLYLYKWYFIMQDNNFRHFHWLKVHHVKYILLWYRCESASAEYDMIWLNSINKNMYDCKDNLPTGIIKYRLLKTIICKMFFNHNPFIHTAEISNFRNLLLKAYYLFTLCFIKMMEDDVIVSCSARSASLIFQCVGLICW